MRATRKLTVLRFAVALLILFAAGGVHISEQWVWNRVGLMLAFGVLGVFVTTTEDDDR